MLNSVCRKWLGFGMCSAFGWRISPVCCCNQDFSLSLHRVKYNPSEDHCLGWVNSWSVNSEHRAGPKVPRAGFVWGSCSIPVREKGQTMPCSLGAGGSPGMSVRGGLALAAARPGCTGPANEAAGRLYSPHTSHSHISPSHRLVSYSSWQAGRDSNFCYYQTGLVIR